MEPERPPRRIDMSQPGNWSYMASVFLFTVCNMCFLFALGNVSHPDERVFAGLLFCGGMLALIASIMLYDRHRRETKP